MAVLNGKELLVDGVCYLFVIIAVCMDGVVCFLVVGESLVELLCHMLNEFLSCFSL